MTTGRVDGSVMEEILVLLGADAHVLLAQVVHMSIDVVCVLDSGELPPYACSEGDLTSCSDRGTLLSLSLCTSAAALPNSAEAVRRVKDFMVGYF